MKKIFLSMLTAVALFASCSQEELVSQTSGEESMVSFTLTTPEMGSRVVGDGTTATDLYFVVYDETTDEQVETISSKTTKYAGFKGMNATVSLPLLNGHKYSLLFWAESAKGVYDVNWDTKSIALTDASALFSNKEDYDAFYAYVAPFTVTGDKSENVELYRPFAQLNIGTTQEDIDRVKTYFNASDNLSQTQIVVKNVPTTMNLATGVVGDAATNGLTYKLAAFADVLNTQFPVADYKYISMNYILVGKAEKTLVDVVLTTNISELEERTYKNVPLQGNYRTNIYGELFTSNSDWNVNIEDEFGTPAYEVLDGVIELTGDITVDNNFYVENSLAINLNGHKLTYKGTGASEGAIMARVKENAILTFNGPGEVVVTQGYVASAKGGKIYVNGGSYITDYTTCFQADGGEVYIKGGYFNAWNEMYKGKYTLNQMDQTKGKIEVTGGAFYQYDPSNSLSENPNADFVPEGYKVTKIGDIYCVTKETAIAAATVESLSTALATEGEVELVLDVETASSLVVAPGTTLNDQGNTVTMAKNNTQHMFTPNGGTIQNINIEGYGERNVEGKVIRGIYIVKPAENVVIDGATVSGVAYPLNTGTKSTVENLTLTVSNSTLIGWSSWDGGFVSANFTNCTFGVGTYFDATVEGQELWNGFARPYIKTVFENCSFEKDFVIDAKFTTGSVENNNYQTHQPEIVLKNCTLDGENITDSNKNDLFENDEDLSKVTVE